MLLHEKRARNKGFRLIAGVDEAGRGCLAGPVVASAVIIADTNFRNEINDSKKLSPQKRLAAYKEIRKKASVGIGIVDESIIDKINIYQATIRAMEKAIADLAKSPDIILIDGNVKVRTPQPKKNIISGDSKSISIAAASIMAKVTRDRLMVRYHKKFPHYGFDKHMGYGTLQHRRSLIKHGPCAIHRRTFRFKEEEAEEARPKEARPPTEIGRKSGRKYVGRWRPSLGENTRIRRRVKGSKPVENQWKSY